jgi:hypothetical protein
MAAQCVRGTRRTAVPVGLRVYVDRYGSICFPARCGRYGLLCGVAHLMLTRSAYAPPSGRRRVSSGALPSVAVASDRVHAAGRPPDRRPADLYDRVTAVNRHLWAPTLRPLDPAATPGDAVDFFLLRNGRVLRQFASAMVVLRSARIGAARDQVHYRPAHRPVEVRNGVPGSSVLPGRGWVDYGRRLGSRRQMNWEDRRPDGGSGWTSPP